MAGEKRLIDANKIPYHRSGFPKGDGFDSGLDWAFRVDIDNAPTIDAVEVVHGRWIMRSPLNPDSNRYCSNCKADISALKSLYYKFCPYCGAKMDGDGNDTATDEN